ncbi:MAG: hypothetical protein ACRDHD_01075 [Candidatus Limnocylindria bacterium]
MIPLLLIGLIGLGGCSWLADARPTPPAGGGTDPDAPIGGGGGGGGLPVDPAPGDGAMREEPDPAIVDARAAGIDRFTIGPDGRTLVIYYWGGNQGCFGLREVLVEVQDGTPIISVLEGTRPQAVGQACTMEALLKSAVVTLDDPILVDGSGADQEPGEPPIGLQADAVEPVAGVLDARAHAVTGYQLSADGLTLTAWYVGGTDECYGLESATVEPADGGGLRVTVREGRLPDAAAACPDIGVAKAVVLTLDAPLIVQAAFDS